MERCETVRRIIANPHPYYITYAMAKHPEVETDWIERTLMEPFRAEIQSNGRLCF